MESFTIQKWLFEEAAGKFDTDLGESGVYRQDASKLYLDPSWDLDYSSDQGSTRLRHLIENLYDSDVDKRAIITHGGQEALYLYYSVLIEPGDEVITTTPGWQQSWSVPERLGARVKKVSLDSNNLSSSVVADSIIAEISSQTRLVVLTNPNNPLGTIINSKEMARISLALGEIGGHLLVDEEYMPDYQNSAVHLGENVTVVSSLSKIHGFPGLRIGWAVGPHHLIHQMVNYRRFSTVANSTLSERFAEQVLRQHDMHVERFEKLSESGKQILHEMISEDSGLHPVKSHGTPFTWIRLPDGISGDDLATRLLNDHQVLVMPSSVFAANENAVRVTHARKPQTLYNGLEKLLATYHRIVNA